MDNFEWNFHTCSLQKEKKGKETSKRTNYSRVILRNNITPKKKKKKEKEKKKGRSVGLPGR